MTIGKKIANWIELKSMNWAGDRQDYRDHDPRIKCRNPLSWPDWCLWSAVIVVKCKNSVFSGCDRSSTACVLVLPPEGQYLAVLIVSHASCCSASQTYTIRSDHTQVRT